MTAGRTPHAPVGGAEREIRARERAEAAIPRGVSSHARLRTRQPLLVRGEGAHAVDAEGRRYVDYVMGFGTILFGHAEPSVAEAVAGAVRRGAAFGALSEDEARLAERLLARNPWAAKAAFLGSGSESVLLAIRLARAATGRRMLIKFEGHYHGWLDPVYLNVPRGPFGRVSEGVVSAVGAIEGQADGAEVIVLRWGDAPALERVMRQHGDRVAAVVMEPIPANFGCFLPDVSYLRAVREQCTRAGSMLVFDEIITGFRTRGGSAGALYGVPPDLAVYGKALASGMPVGAVAGTAAAMAPAVEGRVALAGTFNGSPPTVAAAHATLDLLDRHGDGLYDRLERSGAELAEGLIAAAAGRGVPLSVNRAGGLLQLIWGDGLDTGDYRSALGGDHERLARALDRMLDHGVHALERGLMFVSEPLGGAEIELTIGAWSAALDDARE